MTAPSFRVANEKENDVATKRAGRRYVLLTILGWAVIFRLILAEMRPSLLECGTDWSLFVFAFMMIGFTSGLVAIVVVAMPARILMNLAIKERRTSHRSETIELAVILVLIVAYICEVRRERLRLVPPRDVATLPAFADAMPVPRRLELVRKDDRDFIAWTGNTSGPCDLPSGPSCYLFDDQGDLVHWEVETGDGGAVEDFLRTSVRQRQLTLDEALALADHAAEQGDPAVEP